MKNISLNSFLLCLALAAGTLVSCKVETPDVSPLYNSEKNEVVADFVINIASGQSAQTKMSASSVQKDGTFLGIKDAHIFAYGTGRGYVTPADYSETEADNHFTSDFPLGVIISGSELDGTQNQDNSSRRVLQLSIPVETDAVLIYGRADNATTSKATGVLKTYNVDSNPANTYFHAQRRIGSEDDVARYDATGRLMIFVVNRIGLTALDAVESYIWVDPQDPSHTKTYTNLPAISCASLATQYQINNNLNSHTGTYVTLTPLEIIIGRVLTELITIKSGEYRAGSSSAVLATMKDIFNVVLPVATATPTSDGEANAVRLANAVISRIREYYDTNTWVYKNVLGDGGIKETITSKNLIAFDWDDANLGFKDVTNLNNYPGSFNVPDGAAQLTFDGAKFAYLHPNNALVTPGATFEPRKYLYPVELLYYVNSPLWVTSQNGLQVSDYPNGVNNWNLAPTVSGSKWALNNWSEGKVLSSTRAVAVKHNVAYGVAMLETKVAYGAATLRDNRAKMTNNTESDREMAVANKEVDLVLTGVLIGGQNPRMNWQFIRKDESGTEAEGKYSNFDGVVYDDVIPSGVIPTPAATPVYTLVFDNYNSSLGDDAQNDVYVALEFKNNGDAFWGRDNLVPNGGKFYLVAKLENTEANRTAIASAWPDNSQIPPIDETTGLSRKVPRVFIQDFMTSATFKIGETSLQKAYYTLPDLRSSQMSLGLSVDLQWKTGYQYEVEF